MPSLLLLSGGIDSICLAAWKKPDVCLTVNYGQRAARSEAAASAEVCRAYGLRHVVLEANISSLGSGRMVGNDTSPHSENSEFWPFRNQFLVTLAGMLALKEGCSTVIIGSVVTDGRHADGRPIFLSTLNQLLQLQEGSLVLEAPAATLTCEQLIKSSGVTLPVLSWAHSCHTDNLACGYCPGCAKHSFVMGSLGIAR